jgi:hypothetical protein
MLLRQDYYDDLMIRYESSNLIAAGGSNKMRIINSRVQHENHNK